MTTTKNEIWKAIKGYDGYEVSNMGRVISKKRTRPDEASGDAPIRILKIQYDNKGRAQVQIMGNDGKMHCKRVARMVAEAFLPNDKNYTHVECLDGDNRNCHVENLCWTNMTSEMKSHYKNATKIVHQYTIDGHYIRSWNSAAEIHEKLGIENVSSVCIGRAKSAGGYLWRYADGEPCKKIARVTAKKKRVGQYTIEGSLIAEFPSATEASMAIGSKNYIANIVKACRGERKNAYGYIWKYLDKETV